MEVSEKGLAIIKKYESCRLEAYKDPIGILTIGYGHTKGVKAGQKITQQEAYNFLKEDCAKAEAAVNKYLSKYRFNQNQFDALVSFAFNIGSIDQLTAKGTRTIAKISQMIPAYCNAGGKKLQGLVNRRNEERALFDSVISIIPDLSQYEISKVYTLLEALQVYTEPSFNASKVPYKSLTANAKKHDPEHLGILEAGTRVTCKDKFVDNVDNVWIKIPSGWICVETDVKLIK